MYHTSTKSHLAFFNAPFIGVGLLTTMKKIQYSVSMYANPMHEGDPKKAYASIQLTGNMSLNELANHISEHNSVYSRGTIVGILVELATCIRELVLQGYSIDLGEIGRLTPNISSVGAVSLEAFTADNIQDMKVNFTPGVALQLLRRDAQFERTTTRAAQAAALKAQLQGLTTADWTPTDGDGEEEEPEP